MLDVIASIYFFIWYLIVIAATFTIVLMLVRQIMNTVDVNPFTWHAMTTRKLSDPFINPVKRGMTSVKIPSKFAPLVTILLVMLVGMVALDLLAGTLNIVACILLAARARAGKAALGYLLYGMLSLYSLMILMRIVFTWIRLGYGNRFMRFLIIATDPLLVPLRKKLPQVGMFDISPIIAFIIVWILQAIVQNTLLSGLPLRLF